MTGLQTGWDSQVSRDWDTCRLVCKKNLTSAVFSKRNESANAWQTMRDRYAKRRLGHMPQMETPDLVILVREGGL